MALMSCGECGREVSSLAASCPSCGNPIAGAAETGTVILAVERTAKRFKAIQLAGLILMAAGGVAVANSTMLSLLYMMGAVAFALGIVMLIFGFVRAWWFHG
jgi:hypothetical protein